MKMRQYQEAARRTQNPSLSPRDKLEHATWGLISEVGEITAIFQKMHQGHPVDTNALRKEIGDCLWFIAELCDTYHFDMGCVAEENIIKLRKRYPEGFKAEQSIHRAEGDI